MTEPVWIEKEIVLALHKRHLAEFGGKSGLIAESLLNSALAIPINIWNYNAIKPSIAELACGYLFGISKNHPFIDGNKRTSLIVCLLFLKLNGYTLNASQSEKYTVCIKVAGSNLTEQQLIVWIKQNIK
jgi:death-on-curing protein